MIRDHPLIKPQKIMKLSHQLLGLALVAGGLTLSFHPAQAQNAVDQIEVARGVLKADRQATVAQTLQLTEAESTAFWPLYHQYRAEMDKAGDDLVKLVKEYAAAYPNVPEARAKTLLEDLGDLEKKHAATRAAWLKKIGKFLPASKTLRFAQIESRLDLVLRLELAANIPLVETTK
jgi:Spy/CpxP family protein refolding chaperone